MPLAPRLLAALTLAFPSVPAVTACAAPTEAPATRTLVLSISGMTCAVDCPPRVRAALESVPGVESARVDYDTRSATVRVREGTSVDALSRALLKQGFGAQAR